MAIATGTETGTWRVKAGLGQMLKGGVIMDVVTAEHAKIAEDAGACAVMALERVPADIRADGGVARMTDPGIICAIMDTVSIPVMAKVRIGHFVEAQILEAIGVDYIDESEVLTPADPYFHVIKRNFTVPFVCGATSLGEGLRRVWEGSAMIRTKGEAGTGNIVAAMRHARLLDAEIAAVQQSDDRAAMATRVVDKYFELDREVVTNLGSSSGATPFEIPRSQIEVEVTELMDEVAKLGRLPVVTFTAGGIATPADAALMMQFGMDGLFVGSGIFKSGDPAVRAHAIVQAVTHYNDAQILAEVSKDLGEAMVGISTRTIPEQDLLAPRGI